jgi:hypothetical protein
MALGSMSESAVGAPSLGGVVRFALCAMSRSVDFSFMFTMMTAKIPKLIGLIEKTKFLVAAQGERKIHRTIPIVRNLLGQA